MEFNPEDFPERPEVKVLSLKNTEGFHISFEQKEGEDQTRVYHHLYGEEVFVMTMTRNQVVDVIYALEDFI